MNIKFLLLFEIAFIETIKKNVIWIVASNMKIYCYKKVGIFNKKSSSCEKKCRIVPKRPGIVSNLHFPTLPHLSSHSSTVTYLASLLPFRYLRKGFGYTYNYVFERMVCCVLFLFFSDGKVTYYSHLKVWIS